MMPSNQKDEFHSDVYWVIFIVSVVMVLGLVAALYESVSQEGAEAASFNVVVPRSHVIRFTIDFGTSQREFLGTFYGTSTIDVGLGELVKQFGINLHTRGGEVVSLADKTAGTNGYLWRIYKNGDPVDSLNTFILPGDRVELHYEPATREP